MTPFADTVEPVTYRSAAAALADVDRLDGFTSFSPATAASLALSPDTLRTPDGYRLTTVAVRQLAGRLCPGLSAVLLNIGGCAVDSRDADPVAAAKLLAAVIRLRSSALEGVQLVVDDAAKTIDGIVGRAYVRWSHAQLLAAVAVAGVDPLDALRVRRHGRLLELVFGVPAPVSGRMLPALYVTNGECGEASVKAAPACWVPGERPALLVDGGSRAVPRRCVHSGRKSLNRRVTRLLMTSANAVPRFFAFAGKTLTAGAKMTLTDDTRDTIADRLARAGAPPSLASRVVLQELPNDGRPTTAAAAVIRAGRWAAARPPGVSEVLACAASFVMSDWLSGVVSR